MLDGLDDLQAEIRRNDDDEYVVVALTGPGVTRVNRRTVIQPRLLRTGSRLQMSRWTRFYLRSEDADHGRPTEAVSAASSATNDNKPRRGTARPTRTDPMARPMSRLVDVSTAALRLVVGLGAMLGAGVFAVFGPAADAAGAGGRGYGLSTIRHSLRFRLGGRVSTRLFTLVRPTS